MTECPECGAKVSARTEKNLKGRPSSKSVPDTCGECGATIKKGESQTNRNLLNK